MPKPKSDLARFWRQYAPFIGAAITVLGFGINAVRVYDAQVAEIARLKDHVHVLQRIVVSQFPEWTAAIDWEDQ